MHRLAQHIFHGVKINRNIAQELIILIWGYIHGCIRWCQKGHMTPLKGSCRYVNFLGLSTSVFFTAVFEQYSSLYHRLN